jgi:hypothetical protein
VIWCQDRGVFLREAARTAALGAGRAEGHRSAAIAHGLVGLQRTAGNRAVGSLLHNPGLIIQRDAAAGHVLAKGDEANVPKPEEMDALIAELWPLYDKSRASKKKGGTPMTKEDHDRMVELDRKWTLRGEKDIAETLTKNGQGSPADWFKNVKATPFLGQTVIVHDELKKRLDKAVAKLTDDEKTGNLGVRTTSSLREAGQGLHSFGLALDINAGANPYIVNPGSTSAAASGEPLDRSTAVRAILDRAFLLVLGRTPKEEAFGARPEGTGVDRAEASYDKLSETSEALKTYLTLAKKENAAQLEGLVTNLGDKDPFKGNVKKWRAKVAQDLSDLGDLAGAKQWSDPKKGFLDLPKRLVHVLVDPDGGGLTWLGDDTIGAGRDIMHFDTRGVGPIRTIYKAQGASSDAGWRNLGEG